jgi:hypothetical protein
MRLIAVDFPAGSNITGTAGGLSKVQFTNGSCFVKAEVSWCSCSWWV